LMWKNWLKVWGTHVPNNHGTRIQNIYLVVD